jgi:hypothetical protein
MAQTRVSLESPQEPKRIQVDAFDFEAAKSGTKEEGEARRKVKEARKAERGSME